MSISDRVQARFEVSTLSTVLWFVACTDLIGIPASESLGPDALSGRGGAAGERAESGRGGESAGGGPWSAGGKASGNAGTNDAGTNDAGTSDAGMGGTPATPEFPREGDACSLRGRFACPEPHATRQLHCNGETWEAGDPCGLQQRCNRLTGECTALKCDPNSRSSLVTCTDALTHAQVCGPDYVTHDEEECAFLCVPEIGCVEPGREQVYVDRPRDIQVTGNVWPGPSIPVCLKEEANWPREIAAVKDAFYRSWGRHIGITLTGFDVCEANAEGVELEIAEACKVELARIPITGYPGPSAAVPVTLCRTYLDSAGDLRPVDDDLFRHAVVHVFGHILGQRDERYSSTERRTVMMQAVDLSRFLDLGFADAFTPIDSAQEAYGMPPRGALSGPTGRCLTWTSSSDTPVREPCDGSLERSFRLVDHRLEHVATGDCVQPGEDDTVNLGDCAASKPWEAQRVEWRSYANYCVSVETPGPSFRQLLTKRCTRTADQLWSFEFLTRDRVRIRPAGDTRCVRWPSTWGFRSRPHLGACDDVHDAFETSHGQLSVAGWCLTFDGTIDLLFAPCGEFHTQRFGLSGPLETDGGALTAVPNGNAVELRVTPLAEMPTEEQIFDYYF